MKVFLLTFLLISSTFGTPPLSEDGLRTKFVSFFKNELSQSEFEMLANVLKVYMNPPASIERNGKSPRSNLECLICRSGVAAVFEVIKNGQNDENIIEAASVMCLALNIVSPKACRGVIELNVPIITYIIRTAPEATPAAMCGLLLQNVGSNVCNYNDPRFEWEVELPERVQTPEQNMVQMENSEPLTIVLITDAHIDPYYEPYGVADCDEPTCCRKGQNPRILSHKTEINEKIINNSIKEENNEVMFDVDTLKSAIRETKSVTLSNWPPAGYWGDYRNCDSPIWAYDDVIDRISETHKRIDAVYYMGDSIDHHVWETTYDMINDVNMYIIDKMRKNFGPDVPIIPVIGNHESQPTNQFAPSSVVDEFLNTTWLYEALAEKWEPYLTEEAKATVRERGEFSMLIKPKLRIISINNNVSYRYNWWVVYDPADGKRHLDWLVDELHKAELAGEKVHILAHIPPGVHDLIHTWTREYNKIVNRFSSTIGAEFSGHTHSDEFKIFYNEDGEPINMSWGAGSATAYTNYNLNYKIATIDSNTMTPINIVNYVYNLTEANLTPNRRPHWFQLYDMKNTFGLQDLSASSMDRLVHHMVTDQKHLLDMYAAFYSKLSDTRWPYCNAYCKIDNLCKTVVTVLWERQKCEELRDLFFS